MDKQEIRINVFFIGAIVFKVIFLLTLITLVLSFFNQSFSKYPNYLLIALLISYSANLLWGFLTESKKYISERPNIHVEVANQVKNDNDIGRFNYDCLVRNFLTIVPPGHLIGLSKIIIGAGPVGKVTKSAWGSYQGKREGAVSPIVNVYARSIYKTYPKWLMILCPFIYTMYLGEVIYHEIGHHYQRVGKGYKKQEWENHAERYSKYMLSKYYGSKFLVKLIRYTWFMVMFKKPKKSGKSFK